MTIDAANEAAAQEVANRKGILVARVAPLVVRAAHPTAPAHPAASIQSLEQGHVRDAPVINVAPPRRGNSLGVVSLILGILAFLICWIPLVNLLGVPLAALGLILGAIGFLVALTRKGASIGYPIAGTAICGFSLFISLSMTGALVGGLKKASDEILVESARRNATNQTVVAETTPAQPRTPTTPASDGGPTSTLPPSGQAAEPSPPPIEWAPAETPVRQGDVQVQVTAVKVGQVATEDMFGDGRGRSKDSLLSIKLQITNLSETRKVDYRTWGGEALAFREGARLSDNFGNSYRLVHFGFGTRVAGSIESESIYPRQAIQDVIVFEEPIARAEFLYLELPAAHFNGSGMLRIQIPASMIQH